MTENRSGRNSRSRGAKGGGGRGGRSRSGSRRGGRSRSPGGGRGKASRGGPVEELHPTLDPPDIQSFREWDLGEEIQAVIAGMGIVVPTPIQRLAIQPVLDGRDVIAKAETGTGKTLAFGAPMMARIDPSRASVLGLVLCPTRELAQQVAGVLTELGQPRGISIALVVGGDPIHPQIDSLKAGAQVVVGTPGRVLDLYGQGFLSFPWTEYAILDEADEMLEIGFLDDVKKILSYLPDEAQTLLFSATFPPDLLRLAREHTTDPVEVATAKGVASVETIKHEWFKVDEDDLPMALTRLIEQSEEEDVLLVFCERRTEVDRLMRRMERLPFPIKALHGGYDQASRFRVMSAFREGEVKALIATDVASRGLDVAHVTHVVNFHVPREITDYTHRAGRTGRAGRSGHAVTFVTPRGFRRWQDLVRRMPWPIEEVEMPERTRRPRGGARTDGRRATVRPAAAKRNDRPAETPAAPEPVPERSGPAFGTGVQAAEERKREPEPETLPEREPEPAPETEDRGSPSGPETQAPPGFGAGL